MRFSKLLIVFSVLLPGALVAQTTTQVYNYSVPAPGVGVGYAPNGNLLSYTDNVNGNWTMTYDSLNRLRSATATTGQFQNLALDMTYDSFGNRLTQTSAGSPPIGTVSSWWAQYNDGSNRITGSTATGVGVAYDASGNVLNDGFNRSAYDAEGRVCAVYSLVFGSNVTQYLYDAEGRRVAKGHSASDPSQLVCSPGRADFVPAETYIIGQSGEQVSQLDRSGHWQHTNAYAADQLLATYDNQGTGLHFHVADPLGTRRVQISSAGNVDLQCVSLPFGDYLRCNGPGADATEHHFTGKERDQESQLDYFGARYYGSTMGRWMSPDNGIDQNKEDPQSWNLYSYVRNNPVNRVDPNGRLTIIVPGTGWSSNNWNTNMKLANEARQEFHDSDVRILNWSGSLTNGAGLDGANMLVDMVSNHTFAPGEQLNVIAHSRGGDVALAATASLTHPIDNLITLATPYRNDSPNLANIKNWINVTTSQDWVQLLNSNMSSNPRIYSGAHNAMLNANGYGHIASHSAIWQNHSLRSQWWQLWQNNSGDTWDPRTSTLTTH